MAGFDEAFAEVAGVFPQVQSRRRARGYVLGLLSRTERKNGWSLAEFAGDVSPDGMQRLLSFSAWDAEAARDAVCRYVVRGVGDPAAVLVADETGFAKKGRCSAGVQRQYSGTLGQVGNCQVGVFLAYVGPGGGRALVDRALYLPKSWVQDRERCARAGVPERVGFATKPELARRMVERAVAAGVPFAWFAGDEVYGAHPGLRGWLEERGIGYVLAVACNFEVPTGAGWHRADTLAGLLPAEAWQRHSCGDGAKGPRVYDWALVHLADHPAHRLLIRRSLTPNTKGEQELAYYVCHAPGGASLAELVRVAGARWAVEECFQAAKNETGLDHYQVRRYDAWHRHITLAMLAHAFLAVTAARERAEPPPPPPPPPPPAPAPAPAPAPDGGDTGDTGDSRAAREGDARLWTTIRPGTDKSA